MANIVDIFFIAVFIKNMNAIVIYNKTKAKLNPIRFYIFTIILLNYIFFKKTNI